MNQLKCHTDPTEADCSTSPGAEGAKILPITNSLCSSAALSSFLTLKVCPLLPGKAFQPPYSTSTVVLETLLFKLPIAQAVSAMQFGDLAAPMVM